MLPAVNQETHMITFELKSAFNHISVNRNGNHFASIIIDNDLFHIWRVNGILEEYYTTFNTFEDAEQFIILNQKSFI